jgi:hypothetical protein
MKKNSINKRIFSLSIYAFLLSGLPLVSQAQPSQANQEFDISPENTLAVYADNIFLSQANLSVLQRIETYQAPPFPRSQHTDRETYDYRIRSGFPVPSSLSATLVADLWLIMTGNLELTGLSPTRVREDQVASAINFYLTRNWTNIAGYRPWTHWNFMYSLSAQNRAVLARDVAEYIQIYGVPQ